MSSSPSASLRFLRQKELNSIAQINPFSLCYFITYRKVSSSPAAKRRRKQKQDKRKRGKSLLLIEEVHIPFSFLHEGFQRYKMACSVYVFYYTLVQCHSHTKSQEYLFVVVLVFSTVKNPTKLKNTVHFCLWWRMSSGSKNYQVGQLPIASVFTTFVMSLHRLCGLTGLINYLAYSSEYFWLNVQKRHPESAAYVVQS